MTLDYLLLLTTLQRFWVIKARRTWLSWTSVRRLIPCRTYVFWWNFATWGLETTQWNGLSLSIDNLQTTTNRLWWRVLLPTELKFHLGFPRVQSWDPYYFLAYINDLPSKVHSVGLFADDCILYNRVQFMEDSERLQQDLDALVKWEGDWQMSFNSSNCFSMRITRRRNQDGALHPGRGETSSLPGSRT